MPSSSSPKAPPFRPTPEMVRASYWLHRAFMQMIGEGRAIGEVFLALVATFQAIHADEEVPYPIAEVFKRVLDTVGDGFDIEGPESLIYPHPQHETIQ